MLKLTRPLAIFDIESTGLDKANDRIVSLFIKKIFPSGEIKEYDFLLNPQMHIPEEVSKIHGITDEMVKDAPTFKEKAAEIKEIITNTDLGGYNIISFDIPMLAEEMLRVYEDFSFGDSLMVDSEKIFKINEQRTLSAAVKFYCKRDMEDAHNASADVNASYDVLLAQIERYDNIKNGETLSLSEASKFDGEKELVDYDRKLYKDDDGIVRFGFGKWKGEPICEHWDYCQWMDRQDWITRNTKKCIEDVYRVETSPF